MPSPKIDPPVIAAWANGLTPAQRQQYLPAVRRFVSERGSDDLTSVATRELVSFALAIVSDSSRVKAICALQHFFSKATDGSAISDPAMSLNKAVQRAIVERRLASELSHAGVSIGELSWRDIAALTLADSARVRYVRLAEPLRGELATELLGRLRQAADAQEAQSLLDAPLLEFTVI